MWTQYNVEWNFLTKLVSSVPADPKIRQGWIDGMAPEVKPPESRPLTEIAEEVTESMLQPDIEAPGLHVFQRHEGKIVMRFATVRAHIKEVLGILSGTYVIKIQGQRSFAVRGKNCLYYPPHIYWMPIFDAKTGEPLTDPTGTYDKPVHAMTRKGPISAIKTMEYVDGAMMRWPLWVLTTPFTPKAPTQLFAEEDINTIFQYGGVKGYAGERNDGEGKYFHTMKKEETNG